MVSESPKVYETDTRYVLKEKGRDTQTDNHKLSLGHVRAVRIVVIRRISMITPEQTKHISMIRSIGLLPIQDTGTMAKITNSAVPQEKDALPE